MEKIQTKGINGTKVEGYMLSKDEFNSACGMIEADSYAVGSDSIEDAMPYVNEWLDMDGLDNDYKAWLKKCLDAGAEIYTYKEDWQPISEIAVFK